MIKHGGGVIMLCDRFQWGKRITAMQNVKAIKKKKKRTE